jgi:PAS domain S-box-containing protein
MLMKLSLDRKVLLLIALSICVLCGVGWVSYRNTQQSIHDERWVAHSYAELEKLEEVLSLLERAAGAQRGYVLVGHSSFLQPYGKSIELLRVRQRELKSFSDEFGKPVHYEQLDALIQRRIDWMEQTLSVYKSRGASAAARLIATERGSKLMGEVRDWVKKREDDERSILRQRQDAALESARATTGVIIFGSAVSLLLVVSALWAQRNDMMRRQQAEQEVESQRGLFKQFIYHAPAAVAMFDTQMRYLVFSRRWQQDYQLGERDVTGLSHVDVMPTVPESMREVFKRCLRGAVERGEDDGFVLLDGRREWRRWEVRPWHTSNGNIGGIIMFTEFISDRKLAEERERQRSEGLRMVVKLADHLLSCPDMDTLMRRAIEAPREQLGVDRCALLVLDRAQGVVRGTYGTDMQGRTTNEHARTCGAPDEWLSKFQTTPQGTLQEYFPSVDLMEWNGRREVPIGRRGWTAILPIRNREHIVATFHYDAAISHRPFDEVQHELLSIYTSLLGNIIERRRSEEALRESEAGFRILAQNSSDLIARYTPQGICTYVSPASRTLLLHEPETLVGRFVYDFVHPDDLPDILAFHTGGGELPPTYEMTMRVQRGDGTYVWMETTGRVVRDEESGEIIEFQTASRDISHRKAVEEALRESEERYRELIENSTDLIYRTDSNGCFIFFNDTAMRLMKYSREEMIGMSYLDLVHPDYREAAERFYGRQFIRRIRNTYYEYPALAKDGTLIWFGQNVHLNIEDGIVQGFEAVARDVTARKHAEEELRRAHDELDLRVQQRTAELANTNAALQAQIAEREKAQARQEALTQGLRTVLASTDVLLQAPDMDTLLRSAVELAREQLGLERAGIFLCDGEQLVGTFGTDLQGQTTDERHERMPLASHWGTGLPQHEAAERRWHVYQQKPAAVPDGIGHQLQGKPGWVAVTPIQSSRGGLGVLFNDTAISDAPLNEVQQEIVALFCSLLGNIIERKRGEEALRESEERFRVLTQALPAMVWTMRPDGTFDYLNQHAFDYTGWDWEQLKNLGWFPLLHPDDVPLMIERMEKSKNSGEPFQLQYRLKRSSDNSYRWQLGRSLPLRNHEGEIYLWLGAGIDIDDQKKAEETLRRSRDELENLVHERTRELYEANKELQIEITDRRQTEIALRDSEERFRAFMNSSSVIAFMKNRDGRLIYVNQPFCLRFGIEPDDWLGKNEYELFPPEVADTVHSSDQEVLAGDKTVQLLEEIPMPDGQIAYWLVYKFPLRDVSGTKYLAGIGIDVTEQKQAESQLRETTMLHQTVLNSADYIIISTDPNGTLRLFNKAAERQLGYSAEEVIGKMTPWQFHDPQEMAERARELSEELGVVLPVNREVFIYKPRMGVPEEREWTFIRKDGSRYPVRLSVSALHDPEGNLRGYMGIASDISDEKLAAEALARQTEELRRSNAELEQFAYVASHDLQEPLRMVVSYLQLLERRYGQNLSGDAHEFISYAVDGAKRMQSLINDLLDYSRVGTKGKAFNSIDCNKVVQNSLRNLEVALQESQAQVEVQFLPTIQGDTSQILRLFQNLIANAIKFRSDKAPHVQINVQEQENYWLFSVKDNGIGIAPEHKERIFAVFQRLHSRAEYPGTGIGLAICKKIVERHGGQIWVESQVGEGSIFFWTFPKEHAVETTLVPGKE